MNRSSHLETAQLILTGHEGAPRDKTGQVVLFPSINSYKDNAPQEARNLYAQLDMAKRTYAQVATLLGIDVNDIFLPKSTTTAQDRMIGLMTYSLTIWNEVRQRSPTFYPDLIAASSAGFFPALVASEALSLENACLFLRDIALSIKRAEEKTDYGLLLVMGVPWTTLEQLIEPGVVELIHEASPIKATLGIRIDPSQREPPQIASIRKAIGPKGVVYWVHPPAIRPSHASWFNEVSLETFQLLKGVPIFDPKIPIVDPTQPTGVLQTAEDVLLALGRFFIAPDYWGHSIRRAVQGASELIEIGPGNSLQMLNKRMPLGIPTITINDVPSIERFTHHLKEAA